MMLHFILTTFYAFMIFITTAHARSIKVSPTHLPPQVIAELSKSPIGDNLNVDVYDFIMDEILKDMPTEEVEKTRRVASEEAQGLHPSDKPITAEVAERPFSHILKTLCKGTDGCMSLALYQKNGVMIGYGELDEKQVAPAVLADQSTDSLGIQEKSCHKHSCEYLITQAIYKVTVDNTRSVAQLSIKPPSEQQGELAGFLRYRKRIVK